MHTVRCVASTRYVVPVGGTPQSWPGTWPGQGGGYPRPELGWGTPTVLTLGPKHWVHLLGVLPTMPWDRVPFCQQDGANPLSWPLTWYGVPPPPPAGVNRLKMLYSVILRIRAVKIIKNTVFGFRFVLLVNYGPFLGLFTLNESWRVVK